MESPEELARRNFGARAEFYTRSAAHADPQVLARVVEVAEPQTSWRVLDVATGSGHTAFALAPRVTSVTAIDLTPEMLSEAKKLGAELQISNVLFQIADIHSLPFPDASFELVTCRRAAHHFSKVNKALDEMRRVLTPGGRLVIDDRSVPEDDFVDETMNQLDWLHDESHIRQYRPSEWQRMLSEHGFKIELIEPYSRSRPLTSLTKDVSAANVAKIHSILQKLSGEQRKKLGVVTTNGEQHIHHWYVLIAAVRS
jgi:ubiquinone/menaquinone biosynthesis C-methylase UbiE